MTTYKVKHNWKNGTETHYNKVKSSNIGFSGFSRVYEVKDKSEFITNTKEVMCTAVDNESKITFDLECGYGFDLDYIQAQYVLSVLLAHAADNDFKVSIKEKST